MRPGILYDVDALAHLRRKLDNGEIRVEVGERMLAEFRAAPHNPPLSYDEAWWRATHPRPPRIVFHTAPCDRRASIARDGLRVSQPGQGGSWTTNKAICDVLQASQPSGVYVAREPDRRGMWAHWPTWDVWSVDRGELPWAHDPLNPECWLLTVDVPAASLMLVS